MNKCACLHCGEHLDQATNAISDDMPSPNDITICLHCGHLMAFDDDLKFRPLNKDEEREIDSDMHVMRLLDIRAHFMKEFNDS